MWRRGEKTKKSSFFSLVRVSLLCVVGTKKSCSANTKLSLHNPMPFSGIGGKGAQLRVDGTPADCQFIKCVKAAVQLIFSVTIS